MWYIFVFTQYSYYRDFFLRGGALFLRDCHCCGWVRYIDTTKITVWCMSSLLFSIDLRWLCYFIGFYFKLINVEMVKWCNVEINIRIVSFISCKCWIYLFVLFFNTIFLQQKKQSITFNFWSLTTITATKFMLSNQETTGRQYFIRGQPIVVREIVTLI